MVLTPYLQGEQLGSIKPQSFRVARTYVYIVYHHAVGEHSSALDIGNVYLCQIVPFMFYTFVL